MKRGSLCVVSGVAVAMFFGNIASAGNIASSLLSEGDSQGKKKRTVIVKMMGDAMREGLVGAMQDPKTFEGVWEAQSHHLIGRRNRNTNKREGGFIREVGNELVNILTGKLNPETNKREGGVLLKLKDALATMTLGPRGENGSRPDEHEIALILERLLDAEFLQGNVVVPFASVVIGTVARSPQIMGPIMNLIANLVASNNDFIYAILQDQSFKDAIAAEVAQQIAQGNIAQGIAEAEVVE
ncbi:hypothetical protein HOD08_04420 [bacterium]|jgi:hypothetical protein|nr:hypothetical protein [bacterium]